MAAVEDEVVEKLKNLDAKDLEHPDNLWLDKIMEVAPCAEDQIKYILFAIQARDDFYEKTNNVIKKIENVLSKHYHNVSMKPFGSVLSHLGLKDSDLDVAIEFTGVSVANCLWEVTNLLKKSGLFTEVQARDAAVPIVKCMSPEISLDISFTNEFGINSSVFINEVINVDQRIKSTMLILKFWLTKQGYRLKRYPKLSSYPLALLFIFYLQENNYMNNVYEMQRFATAKLIRSWNFAVSASSIRISNLPPVLDLLKGFFKYYTDFDYQNQVVCPYIGQKLSKKIIVSPRSLPSEYGLYKMNAQNNRRSPFRINNGLCIQDPFVHDRNSTSNMDRVTAQVFQKLCRSSCEILQKEEEKSLECGNYKKTKLFSELFKPFEEGLLVIKRV